MNLNPKNFFFFFARGWGEVVGATRESEFFTKEPICPFNFFEVGGMTMNKCTSYGLTSSVCDHVII